MPLLQMSGVRKGFPGVLALDDVSFAVERGEVRALMGENGAGKSTLIKVLTGVHQPDSGSIALDGAVIRPRSPIHAQELGVSTVYQEVNLLPNLSVAENVCLGAEPRRFGRIQRREMNERARAAMRRLNLDVNVTLPLSEYSTAVQQLVAIARAVDRECRVLVLDEPTSSLDKNEVAQLFSLLRHLRDQGVAVVFVTHFLDQAYAIADSVTVLRNGRKIGDWKSAELSKQELVAHMLGRSLEDVPQVEHEEHVESEPLLQINGLGKRNVLEPATFAVSRGETLGLAGLLGSGRTETMKLIFGAIAGDCGSMAVSATGTRDIRPRSPRDAMRLGIGFCPEDRKDEAVFPGMSVAENMLVVIQAKRGWLRPLPRKKAAAIVVEHVAKLQIRTPDAQRPIENLSGGNQQKVVLSRWLAAQPSLLLLDEPTRGIDIGSKFEIRKLITDLAKGGVSFLFSSSELEEVVHTCDRVVVLRDRKMVGELHGADVNEQRVMEQIAKGEA
jgi:simple sugar transport system ATP-binding protein